MLPYGLINQTGIVPIYPIMVQRVSPERARRIILVAAVVVASLPAAAAATDPQIFARN
jgi:small neutral amino acid transporter SnatA (MarC family)